MAERSKSVTVQHKNSLVRYSAMLTAIEQCVEVDEVKAIHDKALALECYAQQAMNFDAERQAAEIRIRAERKAGELLKGMEKDKGGKPKTNQSHDTTGSRKPKTLTDLGISRDQSSRWQQLAEVPKEQFEAAFQDRAVVPSTTQILGRKTLPSYGVRDPDALWLWGRIRDVERQGILQRNPSEVFAAMLDTMQADLTRLLPVYITWLQQLPSNPVKGEYPCQTSTKPYNSTASSAKRSID